MNKTVNINLGGMFFHIDEDAYQKMTRYFDAIKRSLSNSSGQDEIIKDIEMRVSELLSEKQKTEKHVVTIREVDEVIAIMGQPEDYRIDEEGEANPTTNYTATKLKKLYRDKENGMVGGVLSGLGHYFGIDKVWLRVILLILVCFYGTGLLAYLILWIIMPEATTTSEKLEMTGEPVTISNIEKKVREEFDTVSVKLQNVNYDKFGSQIKTGAEKFGNSFGDFMMTFFTVFAKFLGVILIITGMTALVLLLIGAFTLGTSSSMNFPWESVIQAGNFTDYPIWSFGILMFLAVGIPFFFLMLLGFKLLSPNMKSIGNIAKYTLLAVWLIAVSLAISLGIKQASAFAVNGRIVKKETINLKPNDTLFIKFKHNDYFAKNVDDRSDFLIAQDSTNTDIIYSNEVNLRIEKTDQKLPYIQIEKEAKGKTLSEARQRAEQIRYSYTIIGNHLILDNYLLSDLKNKFRDQQIEITLFLPLGTLLKPDESMAHYDRTDSDYFRWDSDLSDAIYKVESNKIRCLNCPIDENNDSYSDEDPETNVTINEDGISIKKDTLIPSKNKFKELKINKDGIIIKTE